MSGGASGIRYLVRFFFFFQAKERFGFLFRLGGLEKFVRDSIDTDQYLLRILVFVISSILQNFLAAWLITVSYTHLTLPTSDLVQISVVAVSLNKKAT